MKEKTQNSKYKTQNYPTDWHCHLLPGLDDGPDTMGEAVEMAVALTDVGFSTVCCTPHLIRGSYSADNAMVKATLSSLQSELDREGIALRLLSGREYYLDEFLDGYLQDPLPLGDTRFLLVEVPSHVSITHVKETFFGIVRRGFIPMIAHPERCELFNIPRHGKRSLLGWLKGGSQTWGFEQRTLNGLWEYMADIGCVCQGNLGSFSGWYGAGVRRSAQRLQAIGVYTHFGSDAHSTEQARVVRRCRGLKSTTRSWQGE